METNQIKFNPLYVKGSYYAGENPEPGKSLFKVFFNV